MFRSSRWTLVYLCFLAAAAAGCSDAGTNRSPLDAGRDAVSDTDFDASDIGPEDGGPDDADRHDAGDVEDTGEDADAESDADAGSGGATARSLSDYRSCNTDSDCPVGLGNCTKEVSLNRQAQDGRSSVQVSEIFDSVSPGEGICTYVCTDDVAACDDLSMNGTTPDAEPHTCQLVFVDAPPYPASAPAFPFDDQLDPAEQELGAAFGALCRPPFGLDEDVDDSLCASCQSTQDCGDEGAICWNFQTGAAADGEAGTCLPSCSDNVDCPGGFVCDVSDDAQNSYCRPVEGTCSNCRDHDADGFGDGRCADDGTTTPHDCDDVNPDAYYAPNDPNHAFPQFCGEFDYNCNGLSDAIEQVGADAFGAEHCTACFDTCSGAVPNGTKTCSTVTSNGNSAPACTPLCDTDANGEPTHADCDGDVSNGCEVTITNPDNLLYADTDGDGRGDLNSPLFLCDPNQNPPTGYVANADDCDDDNAAAYGAGDAGQAAEEVCDGVDNDCDGTVDEPTAIDAQTWYADTDGDGEGDAATSQQACTQPTDYVANADDCDDGDDQRYSTNTETCDTKDNDCNGLVDDGVTTRYFLDADTDGFGDPTNYRDECSQPSGYVLDNTDCDDGDDEKAPNLSEACDQKDNNCDGEVDEGVTTTYYQDFDGDGFGSTHQPVEACSQPSGYVTNADDCFDVHHKIYPGAAELEQNSTACMKDADDDGYGDDLTGVRVGEYGPTQPGTDCQDEYDTAYPGALEICDAYSDGSPIDSNCDGTANEGCPSALSPGTTSTNSTWVPSFPTSSASFECNDGEVLTDIEVKVDTLYFKIAAMRGKCESLDLRDSDGDGIDDETVLSAGRWLLWAGLYRNDSPTTTETLQLGTKPAEVITSLAVEADSVDHIRELTLNASVIDLHLPNDTGTSPATVGLSAGTSDIFGWDASGMTDRLSECPVGTVATGYAASFVLGTNNTPMHALTNLRLRCSNLDLSLIQ
ncbi:hypothetical protein FIV42_20690 [Persicimonas caeni]|uniref:Uncharacterized protein n=1 Tax=Persicimonas caeni TaxID=2292766 RepID=A0A4Y6PXU2_PERCE|nr:MopE-related protein [Persicimonas caeni]QDG53073.1 hypothetical protein FIV42_20690 [Persicimonas caeni]QED34295.1 hypothetical protein FRD00_20685 [Persicimonas caeni]